MEPPLLKHAIPSGPRHRRDESKASVVKPPIQSSENYSVEPLLNFLAGICKNTSKQMTNTELATEYKTMTGDPLHIDTLKKRFQISAKPTIHMSEQFDIPTRARMLYISKTRVDENFLIRIRLNAIVIVDDRNKIKGYQAFDGISKFGNKISAAEVEVQTRNMKRDNEMLKFLEAISRKSSQRMSNDMLATEYKLMTGDMSQINALSSRFRTIIKPIIHMCDQFDIPTRVRMLYVSKTAVNDGFLERLRENADVTVDGHNIIEGYKASDGSLTLGTIDSIGPLLNFLAEISQNTTKRMTNEEIATDYKMITGDDTYLPTLNKRFRTTIKPRIHMADQFDVPTRVRMLFVSKTPVDYEFLEQLRENADVSVDDKNTIDGYKAYDGSLSLGTVDSVGTMLNVLAEISQNTTTRMTNEELATEYQSMTGDSSYFPGLKERFRKVVKPKIHTCEKFDIPTRVRMLYVSKAQIDQAFLTRLRKGAIVSVDEKMRIHRYEAKDGSLTLGKESSHRMKLEDDYDDYQWESREWTTKSGRVTKRRYPNDDYFEPCEDERKPVFKLDKTKRIFDFKPAGGRNVKNEIIDYTGDQSTSDAPPIKQERTDEDVLYGGGILPLPIPLLVKEEDPNDPYYLVDPYNAEQYNFYQPRFDNNVNHNDDFDYGNQQQQINDNGDYYNNDFIDTIQEQTDNNNGDPNNDRNGMNQEHMSVDASDLNHNVKQEKPDLICLTRFIPDNSYPAQPNEPSNYVDRSATTSQTVSIEGFMENQSTPMQDHIAYPDPPTEEHQDESDHEFISAKGFLKMLRAFVLTMNFPILSPIEQRFKNAIDQIRDDNLPIDDAIFALETIFRLTTRKSSPSDYPETSFPVTKIITLLRNIIFNLDSPKISMLEEKMNRASTLFEASGNKIASNTLQLALETTIELITPRFF